MTKTRIILILVLLTAVGLFFGFDLGQYLTLEQLKSQQAALDQIRQLHPVTTAAGFFLVYVVVTGLSLPGAALMTLARLLPVFLILRT